MNGEEAFKRGKEFYEQKEYLKAIEYYNKALEDENYATPGKALYNCGVAYGDLGKHKNAIKCYNKALKTENYAIPGNTLNKIGIAYGNLGEHEKSIKCYNKALGTENYATPGNAWNNKGVAYENLGKREESIKCYNKAVKCYGKAIKKTPDNLGNTWNDLGITYRNLIEYEEAIKCYNNALNANFDTPSIAWCNMGNAYWNLKNYEESINCYENAIYYDPKYAVAYNNLGEALYKLKRPDDAEEKFRKAIQINLTLATPPLAEPHYYLGHILADEEYYKEAKKEYEIAWKSKPKNTNYLNSLGYVLAKLGHYDKAKKKFEDAISSDPTHVKAHRNIRLLNKIHKAKYEAPALIKNGLMAVIISVIISSHYLLHDDKLSDSKFTVLIIVLVGLLTAIVLLPESKYFKVGPSGIEFSRGTAENLMETTLIGSHELGK